MTNFNYISVSKNYTSKKITLATGKKKAHILIDKWVKEGKHFGASSNSCGRNCMVIERKGLPQRATKFVDDALLFFSKLPVKQ